MPASNDNTSTACETQPLCLCLGIDTTQHYEWQAEHECECFEGDQGDLFRICAGCGAQLIEYDDETGKAVAA